MAIKRGIIPQLAEVGKIKCGYKGEEKTSSNGNKFRLPQKLDYFVITTTERDKVTGNLIKNDAINAKLGKQPKELKIRLPFDSVDKNFYTRYQMYTNKKKICDGDGEKAIRLTDEKNNTHAEIECNPETCEFYKLGKCKVAGILSAFLPDADDFGGVYKLRTHSINSVSSILGALEFFAANTGGILQGLPLKLVMVRKTTEKHGTIFYPTVIIDGDGIRQLRQLAAAEKEDRKLLGTNIIEYEKKVEQSGFFRDTDPEKEVQEEFYPESDEPELKNVTPNKGASADDIKDKLQAQNVKSEKIIPECIPSVNASARNDGSKKKSGDLF